METIGLIVAIAVKNNWSMYQLDVKSAFLNGIYQVFGHTQLKRKPVIKKTFADLDCRKAFLITLKGDIKTIK